MRFNWSIGIAVSSAVIFGPGINPAWSSGYFIDQQSVPGLGRCNAGNVAAAYDIVPQHLRSAIIVNSYCLHKIVTATEPWLAVQQTR